jgi:hypothetical protein
MSEKRAFTKLKAMVVGPYPGRRLDRVENLVGNGWPDVNGCFEGVEFWIEIKEPVEPKRPSTPLFGSNHRLSQEQMNWFKRQSLASGLGYVYIDTGKHRILMGGRLADKINGMTLDELLRNALWLGKVPIKNVEHWEGIVDVVLSRKV